ncbi:gcvH [Symbiodinium natans]|uniref:Glycine cleavage system H protein n=1 Tax=Symbiodinium natans TaxID=878477 RepID=A0A812RWY2_9DINO|nr:gcvH [Symbiodinium natans]
MAMFARTALRASRAAPITWQSGRKWNAAFRTFSSVKYAPTHEWFKSEGSNGVLGISEFAQSQLGEVVYCELPEVGTKFTAKSTVCTLESVKAVGEVYAPVDCEITAVNEKLNDEPALVNSSPEEDGWLIKVSYTGDTSALMDKAAYEKHLESEKTEE